MVLYNKQGEVVAVYPYGSEEQSRFERTKILDDAVEQGIEKIEQLKQSILKKAFEGKLLESDPSGEPAEVLLERSKKRTNPKEKRDLYMYTSENLMKSVERAVQCFLSEKGSEFLLSYAHEQTISHRIAVYLQNDFKEYFVDCEYNKHGNAAESMEKLIGDVRNICKECEYKSCQRRVKGDNQIKKVAIRPDIIIHENRGTGGSGNIIAIEIKKSIRCLFDEGKLKALTEQPGKYKYKLGVSLYFDHGKPMYRWFEDGKGK